MPSATTAIAAIGPEYAKALRPDGVVLDRIPAAATCDAAQSPTAPPSSGINGLSRSICKTIPNGIALGMVHEIAVEIHPTSIRPHKMSGSPWHPGGAFGGLTPGYNS
jgi:hypothetical protein